MLLLALSIFPVAVELAVSDVTTDVAVTKMVEAGLLDVITTDCTITFVVYLIEINVETCWDLELLVEEVEVTVDEVEVTVDEIDVDDNDDDEDDDVDVESVSDDEVDDEVDVDANLLELEKVVPLELEDDDVEEAVARSNLESVLWDNDSTALLEISTFALI